MLYLEEFGRRQNKKCDVVERAFARAVLSRRKQNGFMIYADIYTKQQRRKFSALLSSH